MTANKNITANHLPIELDAYSPVSLQNIGEAVVGRANRNRLAIYIPHSIAELLVIDKTMKPLPLMKLNDDKTILSTGYIGTYDGWPMVTDTFGYGMKRNFLTGQLVELRDTPYAEIGPGPVGSCRLPAELREYNSFDRLRVLDSTPNMGLAVLITRDVWYAVVDDEYFGSHFVPCPDPQKIAEGYVGSFQDFDIVVPVHDSVHQPIDLEPGMYLFKPIAWEGPLLKDSDGGEDDGDSQAFDMGKVTETLASAPKPDPELLAQNEAITKTLALATDYEHEKVVLYSAVSKIEKSKFAEVQLDSLQNVDEIAKPETANAIYFLSRKQHSVFVQMALNSSEFHAAVQYEDLLDGFLGTLHGRPIVTDAFAKGNEDRHDLNGLYLVEVESADPNVHGIVRQEVPLYEHLADLPTEAFRKLDVENCDSIDDVPSIAEDELYFCTNKMWSHIITILHKTTGEHLVPTIRYAEVQLGYLGTLHGRDCVTDAFAPPEGFDSPITRRADLDGLYAVKRPQS